MSLSLGALAAAQIVLSLISQLLIMRIVGVGSVTDAYIAAQAIPLLLTAIIGVSLQNIWLPRFTLVAHRRGEWTEAIAIAQGQTLKLVLVVTFAIGATSPVWVEFYVPGFAPALHELFLLILFPSLAAAAVGTQANVLVAAMRAAGNLRQSEAIALLSLGCSTALIAVLLPRFGILVVPLIAVARMVFFYCALLIQTGRPGLVFRATPQSREVGRKLRGLVGGASIVKSTPLVDRYLGAQAAAGALTIFSLAQLAITSLATVLERSIVAQTVPEFSRLLAKGDVAGLKARYTRTLGKLALCVAGVGVLLLIVRPVWADVLRVLLRFSYEDAGRVWLISIALLPSLFVLAAGSAAVAVFYALDETRTPVLIGVVAFIAGLLVKVVLFKAYGILGLAAGSSIYLAISMVAYHFAVGRRLRLLALSGQTK